MNALTRDLVKLVETAEQSQKTREELSVSDRKFREKLHLMPLVGWLNDPNGLCQFQGIYHAFFQYSPFNAEGGVKMWGHYTSKDMIKWEYQGTALYPDQPFDCHGVYSGSAFIEDGKMYLYYTGNVKLEDGEYDYIRTGREGNTVLVITEDGKTFGKKKELMRNSDYPDDLTCHVRDPKVWKENGTYYMVQGARTNEDVGQVLVFESEDKVNWKFRNRVESEKPFGYMWECPDYFKIGDKKLLSTSVQGLEGAVGLLNSNKAKVVDRFSDISSETEELAASSQDILGKVDQQSVEMENIHTAIESLHNVVSKLNEIMDQFTV